MNNRVEQILKTDHWANTNAVITIKTWGRNPCMTTN